MNEQKAVTELEKGNQLLEEGKLEEAIAAYCCAIELDPANSWFHNQLAEALAKQGRFDEAVTAFCSAIELKPDFSWSHHHLGDALAQQQKWKEAAEAFGKAIELNPQHFGTYCGLGQSLEKLGLLDEAIAAYRRASELNPDADWIHHALASVLQQQKESNLVDEIASYRQIIELNPDNVEAYHNLLQVQPDNWEVWLQLAQALGRREEIEEAIAAYHHAAEINPNFFETYLALGDALASVDRWEEAIASYLCALEQNPNFDAVHYQVWAALAPVQKWEEAAAWYRQALELNPNAALAYHHLGAALAGLKQTEKAIAAYRQAAELNPNFFGTYLALGDALASVKRWEEALASYHRAIELNPSCDRVYSHVWGVLEPVKKWEEAVAWYRSAVDLNPNAAFAHEYLGLARANLNEWEEALACYRRVVELKPDSAEVHFQVWSLLEPLQKWEEAAAFYRYALDINPSAILAYHHLGTALAFLEQWDEALASYRREIELNPSFFWTYLAIGDAQAHLQQWDEALASYHYAIELAPERLEPKYKLNDAVQKRQLDEEIALCRRAIDLNPNYRYYQQLSEVLAKRFRIDEAIAACQQVVQFQPEDAEAYFQLGIFLTLSGSVEEAITAYQNAVRLKPEYAEAYCNLAYICMQQSLWNEVQTHHRNLCKIKPEAANADWQTEHFQATSKYIFIQLHCLTHAERKILKNAGLSPAYLSKIVAPGINQEQVIERGYIDSFCPRTGKVINSNQSFFLGLGFNVTFYRFLGEEEEVFYLIVGFYSAFVQAVYFPSRELIIPSPHNAYKLDWEQKIKSFVNTFKSYSLSCWQDVKDYRSNQNPKLLAPVLGDLGNIGHYFWNEVSGVHLVYESAELNQIKAFVEVSNFLSIRDIFPEINVGNPAPAVYTIQHQPQASVFDICLKNNLFTFTPISWLIKEELVQRIYKGSVRKCEQKFLEKVTEARQNFPLIWITLRSHKRAWISQVEGIANIIKELYKDFPKLGVIFDGIPSEKANMEQIITLIPSEVKTYNALDCAMWETLTWVHAIDLFIAPYGAGMIFTLIANKTGVVHGLDFLPDIPFTIDNSRENSVSVFPAAKDSFVAVVDLQYDDPLTRNYDGNWQGIYDEVIKIVANLKRARVTEIPANETTQTRDQDNQLTQAVTLEEAIALGNDLLQQGQLNEALASYRRALEINPDGDAVHYQVWAALAPVCKWKEAEAWYRQALELNPNAALAYHHLGAALAGLKQTEEAVASYRQAAEFNPNFFWTYLALGDALAEIERWEEAIASYRRALELSPSSDAVYYQVWGAFAPLQKWEEAAAWYRQALEINPNAALAYHHLGAALAGLKQWEAAVASYRRATELNPDFFGTYLLLGDALAAVGRWDEVIISARRALNRNSGFLALHLQLGVALASVEQWEEALASYRQALELTLSCDQKALEIQQERVEAYSHLTILLIQQGLLNEVITCYHQVFNRNPSCAGFYHRLSTILAKQGLIDEALVCFQETPLRQPTAGEVCEYIWKGLHQLGPLDETSLYCQTEIKQEIVETYCIESSQYTVMAINSLADSDKLFLEKSGFSIANLELMSLDDINLEELYINSFDRNQQIHLARKVEKKVWETFGHPDVVQGINFQQSMVETGYIYSICPVSGTVVRSNQSFSYGDTVVIYRFVGVNVFYLIVGGWGGSKRSIYFPHLELILNFRVQDWWASQTSQIVINTLKSYAIISWLPFKSYINDQQKKETVAVSGFITNIGHYFWNDMAGIQNLYENGILNKIDKFLVGPYEYFSIAHIFPEIPAEKFTHTAELGITLFQRLLSNNYFCVRVTDLVVKEILANRVHEASIKRCSPAFLQEVEQAKQHFPLLWVGCRNRNRVWISQVEGTANIIKSLHSKFPNLGVVFGGWSPKESEEATPWEASWLEAPMKTFVEQILALLPPSIKTYNAFGLPTYEKNVWEYAADLYIATIGSDTIYVATLGNKPGVIHSNTGLWDAVEPLSLGIRENCVPPVLIAKEHIIENENSSHMVRNYDCDWKVIYDEVIKIVEEKAILKANSAS
jgi:tetratricopeptide (TPR) repeat protein